MNIAGNQFYDLRPTRLEPGLKTPFYLKLGYGSTLSFTERLYNIKGILKRNDSILQGLSGFACRDFANLYPPVPRAYLLYKVGRAVQAAYL